MLASQSSARDRIDIHSRRELDGFYFVAFSSGSTNGYSNLNLIDNPLENIVTSTVPILDS